MGHKKNGTVDMKYYESKEILDRIEPIRAAIAQALTLSPDKVPIFFSFLLSFFFFFFFFFFFWKVDIGMGSHTRFGVSVSDGDMWINRPLLAVNWRTWLGHCSNSRRISLD